jgi:hypothetical protein
MFSLWRALSLSQRLFILLIGNFFCSAMNINKNVQFETLQSEITLTDDLEGLSLARSRLPISGDVCSYHPKMALTALECAAAAAASGAMCNNSTFLCGTRATTV